jgi:hypothetical protein
MSSHEIDTIVLGVPCTIKFDYQPYEAADTGPEAQYPGCSEELEVTDVLVGDISVWEWIIDSGVVEFCEDAVGEAMLSRKRQIMEDRAETRWSDLFG